MVELMLKGFGGDQRKGRSETGPEAGLDGSRFGIRCYHVNSRLSQKLEDIGDFRPGKFFLLLIYCLQAIWCRFRYRVKTLYYIPAPGKRSALYRDWLVMMICRPFFRRIVLHWHAAGLAKWLETVVQIRSRAFTYRLMKQVDLSVVLSTYNRADAEKLFSKRIKIVSNGIPDPCPEFAQSILPRRTARLAVRRSLISGQVLREQDAREAGAEPEIVNVLYLAHCTQEKGLFDAISGVLLANHRLAQNKSPQSLRLLVTGNFVTLEEKLRFEAILARPGVGATIRYLGFVSGSQKNELFRQADVFCFPTYYQNENQPVNLIEAMAFGLPIITTRWRSIPELFPADYPGLVEVRSPEQVANKLLSLPTQESGAGFRDIFVGKFTVEKHLTHLASALRSVEQPELDAQPFGRVQETTSG
jgi:glycosyltransferase involved in cell wall biosynthesis